MEIITFLTVTIKEILMEYGLWQISLAVTVPILAFVSPKLINAIANLLNAMK
ncbi:hypothetical protein DNAOFDDG_00305 [Mannheimia haemolytica]|uniref:Uncharacterized protein n=1 Tax=Mannheimia haemolytica TaxID=75985 RepID=A0A378NI82_MANHA|nr:hypothetical protein [Mannheimia haemolytica]YP_009193628.1 hypothetical protein AU484_gp51 [Mannheimia phage vB_MhS_587AP2]YP_009203445.1 hypothetical protein AVV64_gp49 [Mannheimia phage vB_MhS_535AP2]YP_009213837.1 hypothetical protein AVV62_gp50 [Mannheimia phage vB_MhS_1152AP2]AJA73447.1 hypothetical protein 3927AP1_83 [Mannheimia phage vB_MhS_3927AP1]EDN75341.1 hypothetical protein MHA_2460 [Mannheimia haemolytica PHL213]AGK02238.1 hypothetical protein MHH_c17900 [Mannheimia haemolyt